MRLTVLTFLPVVGVLVMLLFTRGRPRAYKTTALVTSLLTLGMAIYLFAVFDPNGAGYRFQEDYSWVSGAGIRYHLGIDGISLLLILLTALLSAVAILTSWNSIKDRGLAFFASLLVLETGMLGVFVAMDLFLFYVFWEVQLIPMYFIIGVWGGLRRIYAAVKFFLFTFVGSVLMLVAILAVVWTYGTRAGNEITFDILTLQQAGFSGSLAIWSFIAFFVAFAIKVPMFPVHTWLPDAHTEAPTAGSVLLAGVLLKMGVYGMIRFCIGFFPEVAVEAMVPVLILSAIAVIYGAAMSLVQPDMKRLVAYSSVSHMGFVTAGLFVFNQQGVEGSVLQMISHGILTGALFVMVGFFYDRTHTRMISDYGGLAKPMPVAAAFFSLFVMGSLGLPGLSGFVGEFLVLVGVFQYAKVFAALISVGIVLSAAYLLWMYQRTMFQGPNEKWASLRDLSVREIVTLVPLVAYDSLDRPVPGDLLEPAARSRARAALARGGLQVSTSDLMTVLPELVLAVAACLVLLVEAFMLPQRPAGSERLERSGRTPSAAIAFLALVGSAVASFWVLGGDQLAFHGTLASDEWAVFFDVLFAVGAAVVVLMSPAYLRAHGRDLGEYYALMLFAVVGMDLMASARDFLVFYVSLELMAISSYLLAAFLRHRVRSNESALKYFLTGSFASAVILYGISLVYGLVGSTSYAEVGAATATPGGQIGSTGLVMAAFLVAAGLAFKVSAAPFHMWTPDVYEGAPTPVTAFFSVGPKVAGFSVLLAVFPLAFGEVDYEWGLLFTVLAILTMLTGNLYGLVQTNVKRMLAYSSIAHAGYLLTGLGALGLTGEPRAGYGVLVYLAAYTVMNLGAFGVLVHLKTGSSDKFDYSLSQFAGLGRRSPWMAGLLSLFLLSLIGIPGTAGFIGKFYLFGGLVWAEMWWLAVVGVLMSAVSAYYYLRVIVYMFFKESEAPFAGGLPVSRSMTAALTLSALATLAIGLMPSWLWDAAVAAYDALGI